MFFHVSTHRLHAEALEQLIGGRYGDKPWRYFSRVEEAMDALREESPTLLVTDFILGGATACSLLRGAARHAPDLRVVVLTESPVGMRTLLENFNVSLVYKHSGLEELFRAIDFALENQSYIDSSIAARLMGAPDAPEIEALSERELEVMQCYLDGMRPEEIAERLFISVKTVRAHKANIMHKLGLHSDFDLFRFGMRHRLLAECLEPSALCPDCPDPERRRAKFDYA